MKFYTVPSFSVPGKKYLVIRYPDGVWHCGSVRYGHAMLWKPAQNKKPCIHIRAIAKRQEAEMLKSYAREKTL